MASEYSDLEQQVASWLQKHVVGQCSSVSEERIEELQDHLMCVAEAAMSDGHSAEEALRIALEQFGSAEHVREQVQLKQSAFRRWLSLVHCGRTDTRASDTKLVTLSLVFAAALLVIAWFSQGDKAYAFLSTSLIAVWVVIAARQGGTRAAAQAEWRWIKRKLGV